MEGYHCTVAGQTFVPDNKEMIEQAIKEMVGLKGCWHEWYVLVQAVCLWILMI